eukprot:TRINITY_DN94482_c0_g1_i1.p1 TRINITY_DN94482_c0_g1~~TRINITY_DN94482_c0_g1_i1.p1  ORF type:complete len:280 (-),score=43.13 TRINITY_DN94482_c0_g1_i1:97-936(-)
MEKDGLVRQQVAVDWFASDAEDQCESWLGWVVGYNQLKEEHVVVYEAARLDCGKRVFTHKLSELEFKFIHSASANANAGKAWTQEHDDNAIRLKKRIKKAAKRGEDDVQTQTWLWVAASCELGRLQEAPGTRLGDSYSSLKGRCAYLSGRYQKQSGRKGTAPTGLGLQHVVAALRELPNNTGNVVEIRQKVKEIYGEQFGSDIASGFKTVKRWEHGVGSVLKNHPKRFVKKQGITRKQNQYTLVESDSAESPPKGVRCRDSKSRKAAKNSLNYIKAFRK